MNKSSLIVMVAIVAVLALGLLVVKRDAGDGAATGPGPLRSIDWSSVTALTVDRSDGQRWGLRRSDDGWLLTSPEVAAGRPVAANEELVARMLSFLRDARPLDALPADGVDLAGFGLAPPSLILGIEDAQGRHEIAVGTADFDQEVGYRSPGGELVHRAPARVFGDLRSSAKELRSPKLVGIPFGQVAAISALPAEGRPWRIERSGARWLLVREGAVGRADNLKSDQLAAGIAGMRGVPTGQPSPETPPLVTWSVTSVDGDVQSFAFHGRIGVAGEALVAREDEDELRRAPAELARFLETQAAELESSLLTDFVESDLAGIVIDGPARPEPLVLDHWRRRFWYLRREDGASPRVDVARFGIFRDRILSLRAIDTTDLGDGFTPHWRLTFSFAGDAAPPPVVVEIDAPDGAGRSRARRSDVGRGYVVDASVLDVLDTRYWELMQRAVAQGNDSLIDWLSIRDQDGTLWTATKETSATGTRWVDESGEEISEDFLKPLLARLAYLVAEDFVGELDDETRALLDEPRYVIAWRHPEAERPEGGTDVPIEKVWTVGGRIDEVHRACTLSSFPGLVFTIAGKDLLPVESALGGLRR